MMAWAGLELLQQRDGVHTRSGSLEKVLEVARTMQQQGRDKLMVVTDFDMTLSQYFANGSLGMTSFAVIETSNLMPLSYREEVAALKRKYGPMEMDPDLIDGWLLPDYGVTFEQDWLGPKVTQEFKLLKTLSQEERKLRMDEWYSKAHNLLVEHKVKKSDLNEIVQSGNIKLRDGCDALFRVLDSNHVPVVIISAGVADTLVLAIEQQSTLRDNIKVISNNFVFDEEGAVTGFSETLITSSNKGSLHNQFAALSDTLKGRSNVVLLGDSLCDPQMIDGMETRPENLIKIGFLNHSVDKLLSTYLDLYDIVLTGDCDMSAVNSILQFILQTSINGY